MLGNIEIHSTVEKVKFEKPEDQEGYRYSDDTEFNSPVVIRGTSKQLVPNAGVIRMKKVDSGEYQALISSLKGYEDTFLDVTVASPAKLNLVAYNATGFICKIEKDGQPTLYLLIPSKGGAAIKQLAKILSVPYSYAKRSPGDLNETNFKFWATKLTQDQETPLRLVYTTNDPTSITLEDGTQISANKVVTVFKAKQKKEKGIKSIQEIPLNQTIPMISQLMEKIVAGIGSVEAIDLTCNQAAFGYEGDNKGDHHLRLLLNKPDLFVKIGTEEFRPTLSLYSNFDGSRSTFGYVQFSFGFMRLACSNGMVVPMRDNQVSQVQERWVAARLAELKVTEENPRYQTVLKQAQRRARRLFGNFSITLKLGAVMGGLNTTEFPNILRDFLTAKGVVEDTINQLNVPFVDVREEEFVDVVDNLCRKAGVKDSVPKYVIMEYLKGMEQDKVSPFKTPMDIVNFVTFIGKAWDTECQRKIESVSMSLGLSLAAALIQKKSHRNELLSKYKAMVK